MKNLYFGLLIVNWLATSCSKDTSVLPVTSALPGQGSDRNYDFTILTPHVISDKYDGPVLLEYRHKGAGSDLILNANWGENISLLDDGKEGDKVANDEIYSVS